ncbi:MAG: PIN domain-containing protein [Turneriella sp.]
MNVIPDTPIWSLVLRRDKPNVAIQQLFARIIDEGRIVLPGIIKQELLSGIRNDSQFDALSNQLTHFPELLATDTDHLLAARFFNKCQKSGIQGSHVDFLILAIAVNNSASILTSDKDFHHYRKHISFELQMISP